MQNKYVEKVQEELKAVVAMIKTSFNDNYAMTNPDLVRHLMDKVQEQKYIELKVNDQQYIMNGIKPK